MPDFRLLFPARFLKAVDLRGADVTLKITEVGAEELEGEGGKKTKLLIKFDRRRRNGMVSEIVCNRTNAECVAAMFGPRTEEWIGKRITLWPMPFDGDFAIRVRGSPDLKKDLRFELRLPRKKPVPLVMKKTGEAAAAAEPELGADDPAASDPAMAPGFEIPPEPGAAA